MSIQVKTLHVHLFLSLSYLSAHLMLRCFPWEYTVILWPWALPRRERKNKVVAIKEMKDACPDFRLPYSQFVMRLWVPLAVLIWHKTKEEAVTGDAQWAFLLRNVFLQTQIYYDLFDSMLCTSHMSHKGEFWRTLRPGAHSLILFSHLFFLNFCSVIRWKTEILFMHLTLMHSWVVDEGSPLEWWCFVWCQGACPTWGPSMSCLSFLSVCMTAQGLEGGCSKPWYIY